MDASSLRRFQESLDRVNRAINYLTRVYLGKQGLGMSRFRVLMHLFDKGESNMSKLQKSMFLSSATLTGLVDSLVDDGLVVRSREGEDRRMVYLRLTGAGEVFCQEVLDYRCSCLRGALAGSPAGLEETTGLLNSIFDGLREQIVSSPGHTGGKSSSLARDDTGH